MNAAARTLTENYSFQATDDKEVLSLISVIKKGIKYATFQDLWAACPFTLNEWSKFLNMSERTMQRYKKEKKTFDVAQSERILQIILLNKLGLEVFGSQERFNTWLEAVNVALGSARPKSFLDNSFGIQLLRDELMRIEHGVLA